MGTERIEELKKKREQLSARIQECNAQRQVQARKADLKRKLVAGAIFLEEMYSKDERIRRWFDARLKRPQDRKLFGIEAPASATDEARAGEPASDITS